MRDDRRGAIGPSRTGVEEVKVRFGAAAARRGATRVSMDGFMVLRSVVLCRHTSTTTQRQQGNNVTPTEHTSHDSSRDVHCAADIHSREAVSMHTYEHSVSQHGSKHAGTHTHRGGQNGMDAAPHSGVTRQAPNTGVTSRERLCAAQRNDTKRSSETPPVTAAAGAHQIHRQRERKEGYQQTTKGCRPSRRRCGCQGPAAVRLQCPPVVCYVCAGMRAAKQQKPCH